MKNMKINLENNDSKVLEATKVNSLPCKFSSDVKSENVEVFFESTIQPSENKAHVELASFRGRPLQGTVVNFPPNYTGVLLEKVKDVNSLADEYKVSKRLLGIRQWNLDAPPSSSDKLPRALNWTKIAHIIHDVD